MIGFYLYLKNSYNRPYRNFQRKCGMGECDIDLVRYGHPCYISFTGFGIVEIVVENFIAKI